MSCGIFLGYLGPSFQDSTVITHALNYCVKSDIQQAKWHYHERKYPETTQISYLLTSQNSFLLMESVYCTLCLL